MLIGTLSVKAPYAIRRPSVCQHNSEIHDASSRVRWCYSRKIFLSICMELPITCRTRSEWLGSLPQRWVGHCSVSDELRAFPNHHPIQWWSCSVHLDRKLRNPASQPCY